MILSPYLRDVLAQLLERSRAAAVASRAPRIAPFVERSLGAHAVRVVDGRCYAARAVSRREAQGHDPVGSGRWR